MHIPLEKHFSVLNYIVGADSRKALRSEQFEILDTPGIVLR